MHYEKLTKQREDAHKLEDFLALAGWEEVLLPAINESISHTTEQLVTQASSESTHLTSYAAGIIQGMRQVIHIIESITSSGDKANTQLIASQQTPASK